MVYWIEKKIEVVRWDLWFFLSLWPHLVIPFLVIQLFGIILLDYGLICNFIQCRCKYLSVLKHGKEIKTKKKSEIMLKSSNFLPLGLKVIDFGSSFSWILAAPCNSFFHLSMTVLAQHLWAMIALVSDGRKDGDGDDSSVNVSLDELKSEDSCSMDRES